MIRPHLSCKKFFLAVVLSFFYFSLFAADRYSVATGNWNSTSTWSASSGGASGASFPVAGDNVFLENGYTVTVTANAACSNITFTSVGAASTLSVNSSITLTVSSAVTLYKLPNADASCIITGSGTLSCASLSAGSGTNNPTNNNTTRTHTITSRITALNITGNLSVNSYHSNNNRVRNGVFNLESGIVTVGGSITTANENGNNTSLFSMASGVQTGTLILSGATPFTIAGSGTSTITLNGTSALVNYNRAGAQTAYATLYTNLTLSGSGAKTITGTTINAILSIEGTSTAGGTTPAFGAAATIQYKGSAAQTTGIEFPATFNGTGGIIINNSAGVSLGASKTLGGLLTLTGGTFAVGANTLTMNGPAIAGTATNLTTTSSSGLVFGGSAAGINIPSSITSLRNLTINNASGVSMTSNIALASNGILTLTSGILQAGVYTLNISNNSSAAIVFTAGSFVNVTSGSLQRTIAANLSGTGNNYLFPIGEGNNYKAINLIDVNTGTTGPVLNASVNASGAVNGDNTSIGPVDPRYWSLINTNGGNFLSASIELYETGLNATKAIGMSTAVSGIYSSIGGTSGASSIVSYSTLNPAAYFCIGTKIISTFYSYQTGSWNTPETWTSDPSGTLQIGSSIPGNEAIVVILSDRTVTLPGNITSSGLDITINQGGFLDLSTYRLTNICKALRGQGTLKLASADFPPATINSFVNSGGGTAEYYNAANFTLLSSQTTYNNLTINTPGVITTQLSNITLNGNLYIKNGTYRINDNAATAKLTLSINGNVTVDNGASVAVGNGITNTAIGGSGGSAPFLNYYLNFHTVIVKGDFTNNGTVRFTNLNYPVFNAFPPTVPGPTCGAATVYFQGSGDNTLSCNGVTTFYNLILNKGVDQTYKLNIISSAYGNFRLYGANIMPADGAVTSNPDLRKALWIYSGTLVLKGSLIIPSLSEGVAANADYYIPSNGALLIDGVDVVVLSTADDYREINVAYTVTAPDNPTIGVGSGGVSALDIFGKLQINNGFLSTRESGGLITSSVASGQLLIYGGTIDAKQFLSSTGSASFSQTGGLLIVRGRFQRVPTAYSSVPNLTDVSLPTLNTSRVINGISSGFGSFNLENTTNIFTVSGGTIRIYDVCGVAAGEQKAFDVKSSSANINVTGGTLEIIPVTGTNLADATNYRINSAANIYNLVINKLSSNSVIGLSAPLTVQNTCNLSSGTLVANNFNLTIGGNVTIENGTVYTPGTNTTLLNGSNNQNFTINLASALSLYGFTITKSSGTRVTLGGTQGTLNITNNFNLTLGTLNDGGKTINISGNVFNSGIHRGTGAIVLNGTNTQTIDGAGTFQNLVLNNTNAASAPVSLIARTTIKGVLTFSQNKLFNIGIHNLLLDTASSISGSGSARYIQTAGNAGDGGLTKVYTSINAFTFPVGAPTLIPARAVKFTPATIGFNSAPSSFGSVTVIPVGYEHPATTVNGQSLTYFWRVNSAGFSGIIPNSVTHSFLYDQSDVVGTEGNYIPSLYERISYTWFNGQAVNINTTTNTITDWSSPSNSTNFLDADYTAGDASFGTPRIYYSRQSGVWSATATWSLTGHTVNNPPASPPGINDVVIIGNNDSIYLSNETPPFPPNNGNPAASYYQLNKAAVNCANLQIEAGSVLDVQNNPGSYFGSVISHPMGNGKIRLTTRDATNFDNPEPFIFPSGDFSDFNANNGISEFYSINPQQGTYFILPSNTNSYGTVILTPLRGSNLILPNLALVTIQGDLICNGSDADAWLAMTWNGEYGAIAAKTVNVSGDLSVLGGSFGFIYNGATLQQINIAGDVYVSPGAGIDVWESTTNNLMSIGGNLNNNSDNSTAPYGTPSLVRFNSGGNRCSLIFTGPNSSSLSNDPAISTTPVTSFYNVTINKGTSPDSTVTWNIGGSLTTPSDNWLTLQNGTLVYDRTGNFTISQATNFTIPETAGLTINTPSNVYIADNAANGRVLFLSGKLTILNGGGNVYIGPAGNTANNADIEYTGSGASSIDIRGGNIYLTGQIRRPVATTNGILDYTQSGGNLIIYGNNSTLTKAKLEILNEGSSFSMSGGTLTIVRGGGTTFGDLYLRPETYSVSGGTVIFTQSPATGPVIDVAQTYSLDARIPLNNLTITGKTAGTPRTSALSLIVSPLILNGSLTLSNAQSTFGSNSLNVSIMGDLNNNGTYNYGTNKTIFNGGIQSITGTSLCNFYDLEVSSVTSLSVNGNFTVFRDLEILSGNMILTSSLVTLAGNLVNSGSYSDNNTSGGISFSGSAQQQITGNGSFGRMTVNNTSGVKLNNDISLQNDLILTAGILDINKYQLTLSQNSLISGAPFNSSKMIKSDGVSSSMGVMKFFTASPSNFTFPVGVSGKYTPAIYTITANGTVGSIRVNPIDECNPSVTDPSNALGYYWHIESSGISGFTADLLLQYLVGDVAGTESDYVAARLILPGSSWDKAPAGPTTDNVNETSHQITFRHSGTNNLNGDYTAGNDAAIPDEVPAYQTNSNGLWSDQAIWTPVGSSPPCPSGGPAGSNVIINHIVTINTNYISALNTTINNELRVNSPTFGHNLGYVNGNGKLYLQNGTFPGGVFADFLNCSGNGTIEYGGTGTYSIIASQFNSLPNLFFTGTGSRVLPSTDLTICKRLVIDGPNLDNSVNNRKITLYGTIERYNASIFNSGTGYPPSATIVFAGTSLQSVGGPTGDFSGTSKFNNIQINNPAGINIGTNGLVEVNNQLLLTNGIIGTGSSSRLVLLNTSPASVSPVGGKSNSFVNGPLTKYLINGDAFLFPLGEGIVKSHDFTLTSASGSTLAWTVEYTRPNPTSTSLTPPLQVCNTLEYWSISSTTNTAAKIKIAWDPLSDLTPLMTLNGITDMRVAEYNTGTWTELQSVATGNNYYGDVATVNNITVSTLPKNYTTASITGTLARASFSPSGPLCGFTGIPVSFVSFNPITLNYILSYTINNVPQTDITVTSLPYTMPTPVTGTYRLTGFRFNNGSGRGVVDATPVTVYAVPTNSNAGLDQSLCGVSSTTLTGNNPAPYAGLWTIVSGSGGSFINSVQNNTVFNGILGTSYTLRWTISNGPCSSSDDVIISFPVVASTPGDFTSAPPQACQGSTGNIYTVPFVAGVIYNWSYSGTGQTINGSGNSVTIDFALNATGGILSVTATNDCGTSSPRNTNISVPSAAFSYTGTPYCQNVANPAPVLGIGSQAGTFTSAAGLVFISPLTGQINLTASTSGSYIITNTVDVPGCGTLVATSPVTISGLTWNGSGGTNWNVAGNWSCGYVPYATTHVLIPDVVNKPILNGGSPGVVNNLTIETGSSLSVSGNTLQISGAITNNGIFDVSDGTVLMNGSSAQTIGLSVFSGNTIRNLTISNAAGVSLLGQLNVTGILNIQNGTLSSNGFLTLISSASQTALIDGSGAGTITGNVTMQRYLPSAFGYKYVSSPFQSATVNQFSDEIDLGASWPTFYRYDESMTTSGWVTYVTTTNRLNPLEGYAANFGSSAVPVTADVSGIISSGALSVTLYNHNNTYTKGFNLVGNPYPSPIDWDAPAGWTRTNIDDAVYYFKASTTDEYGGKYSAYINGVSSDDTVTNIIPSMQGFFVHVTNGPPWPVTATLSLNNSVRVTDLTSSFLKSGEKNSIPLLRLGATFADDMSSTDPMVVYFDEKAGTGFDSYLDALKLMNTDFDVPNLYSTGTDGTKLSINALPEYQDTSYRIPLGLKVNKEGYIIFRMTDLEELSGKKIFISDMATGTQHDLLNQNEYRVYLNSGEYKERFFLNLSTLATDIPDTGTEKEIFSVYASHGVVKAFINTDITGPGRLSVYNLTGQVLYVKRIFVSGYIEFNPFIKDGIYVVTFDSGNYRDSKKIFIQNR